MSSYINHQRANQHGIVVTHDWRKFALHRLTWIYGYDRASRIMAGQDEATQADLRKWNNPGTTHEVD